MSSILLISLALFFVLLNGFFVLSEFALVKLRQTQVQTLQATHGFRSRILVKVHHQLDAYLSACQLGITLASLGLGWIGKPAFTHLIAPMLKFLGVSSVSTIEVTAFLLAFSLISYLHIVVGELMPKSLAIRRAEFWSLWTAVPLYLFYWLMYPAIWLLNASANGMLKFFRLDGISHTEQSYSSEELKFILKSSHHHGDLALIQKNMLEHTLEFSDLELADIMQPAEKMVSLDIGQPLAVNLEKIMQHRYSRYPVFLGEPEQVIGILHIKDLFIASQQATTSLSLKPLLRPIIKVRPDSRAIDLLQQFQQGMPHFALVYHRGRVVGFVTLDHLLQVLLGRIKDEFHMTTQDVYTFADGSFLVKGNTSIYTLEQLLERELPELQAPTVSGLILEQLQRFPQEGEQVEFSAFNLIVEKIQGPRIVQVHIYPKS